MIYHGINVLKNYTLLYLFFSYLFFFTMNQAIGGETRMNQDEFIKAIDNVKAFNQKYSKGITVSHASIKDCNIQGIELLHAQLNDLKLIDVNFDYSNIINSEINNTTFTQSTLKKATLKNTSFRKCIFYDVAFDASNFVNVKFEDCEFNACTMNNTIQRESQFIQVLFNIESIDSQLIELNISKSSFQNCDYSRSEIVDVHFYQCLMGEISFSESQIKNVSMSLDKCKKISFAQSNIDNFQIISPEIVDFFGLRAKIQQLIIKTDHIHMLNLINASANDIHVMTKKVDSFIIAVALIKNSNFTGFAISDESMMRAAVLQNVIFDQVIFNNLVDIRNADLKQVIFTNCKIHKKTKVLKDSDTELSGSSLF